MTMESEEDSGHRSSAEELARLLSRDGRGGSGTPWHHPTGRSGVQAPLARVALPRSENALRSAEARRGGRPAGSVFGDRAKVSRPPLGEQVAADAVVDLVVCEGELIGRRFRVTDGTILGRAVDADIQLTDRLASRHHARITAKDGHFVIEDIDSHNGLFVNRRQVSSHVLSAGDVIRIGDTPLAVHVRTPPRRAPLAPPPDRIGEDNRVTALLPEDQLSQPDVSALTRDGLLQALGVGEDTRDAAPAALQRMLLRTRHFAVVYGICREIGALESLGGLLRRALEHLHTVTAASRGHIVLLEPESGAPELILSSGPDGVREGTAADLSQSIVEWVVRQRSAVVTSNACADERFAGRESVAGLGLSSVLCVPMLHEGAVIGVIQLDRVGQGRGFNKEDLHLVAVLAPVLAMVVRNVRLHEEQRRSIAELSRAHRELLAAQEALIAREKMAVIGRFAAGMAHEVRNALVPMSLLDDVADALPPDCPSREDIELMQDALDRLRLLVEEVGLLARGQAAPLQLAERDLSRTVDAVLALMRCDPVVRQHQLVVQAGPVAPFRYDDGRLKQVLINLVHNAAQALPAPGDIVVRFGPDPQDAEQVLIEVQDKGRGIPPEALSDIWQPFYTTKGAEGSGLGLDVSRRIVERHGGTITCASEAGRGTTMSVRLRRTL